MPDAQLPPDHATPAPATPAPADQASPLPRRDFLMRAGALTLAIPGAGALFTACGPSDGAGTPGVADSTGAAQQGDARPLGPRPSHEMAGGPTTPPAAGAAPANAPAYHRYDPALPALSRDRTLRLTWRATETRIRISDDRVVNGWTFENEIPGPIVHCRVGDTVEFTLTNEGSVPHSMDFHAAQVDPKEAFRSVMKGQSVTFRFQPKWAGAYMYHCGTAPVLMHIGSGMYGAIIVSPRQALPPAKEFVLVQSEYYFGETVDGVIQFDYQKMLGTFPDVVCFNGRPGQYIREPIRVKVGDRVRFWVVAAGPNHGSAFHIVGEQFDRVYLGAPPENYIQGVQTFSVPAGGGMVFECVCDVAGEFPFVNHSFGHGEKGAVGILIVEP
jgi:nitrite reductase (NO-forming)